MWGNNRKGQLGNGTTENFAVPIKVLDNISTVSCGDSFTAVIRTDGSLWMWGYNGDGQLGNGYMGDFQDEYGDPIQANPIKVLNNVSAVSCGSRYTAVIMTDGSLWTWGRNWHGELGNGTTEDSAIPVKVMDDVIAVSCGAAHTAAIKTDGSLWVWGENTSSQFGNGTMENSSVPIKVMDNVSAVSCGGFHTAAVKTDGSLWTWGFNGDGQLGNGGGGNSEINGHPTQTVPVKVMEQVVAVSCGNSHTAAIKADGSLWSWGFNFNGELGNGGGGNDATSRYSIQTIPVKVLDNVAAISCGGFHTTALKADGSLWTWGDNNAMGTFTVPMQVTLDGVAMPKLVRIYLGGGTGNGTLWTNAAGTIQVPTNPTRDGYTFGGWYVDEALTTPWNFNDAVVNTLVLYAKWVPVSSTATTVGQSTQKVSLNGVGVDIQGYTLIADNGGDVTYVKLRDVAALLDGTEAQFNVDWRSGAIYVDTGKPYTTKNGTELKAITGVDGTYNWNTSPVLFDGETRTLEGIFITDGDGGGHTFFKLRDLGAAIGFDVGWSAEKGIYIETDKAYDPND